MTEDQPQEAVSARLTAEQAENATGEGQAPSGPETGAQRLEELRARLDAKLRPAMLIGLQDAELYDEPGQERINEWVDWILNTVLEAARPAPAPGPADVRDQIAEALMGWAERNNAPQYAAIRRPDTVVQNAYSRADAVLQVPAIAEALTAAAAVADIARGYCPDCGRGDAAPSADQWLEQKQRAERAEAAVERVRKLHERWDADPASCAHCVDGYGTPLRYPCPTIRAIEEQP